MYDISMKKVHCLPVTRSLITRRAELVTFGNGLNTELFYVAYHVILPLRVSANHNTSSPQSASDSLATWLVINLL